MKKVFGLLVCILLYSYSFAISLKVGTVAVGQNVSHTEAGDVYLNKWDATLHKYYALLKPVANGKSVSWGSANNIYKPIWNDARTNVSIKMNSTQNILYYSTDGSLYHLVKNGVVAAFKSMSDLVFSDRWYRLATPIHKLKVVNPSVASDRLLELTYNIHYNTTVRDTCNNWRCSDYSVYKMNSDNGIRRSTLTRSTMNQRNTKWKLFGGNVNVWNDNSTRSSSTRYALHRCGDGHVDNGKFENYDGDDTSIDTITEECDPTAPGRSTDTCGAPGTANACKKITTPTQGQCNSNLNEADIYNFDDNGSFTPEDINGENLCTAGIPTSLSYDNHQWTWKCMGSDDSASTDDANCTATELYCGDGVLENNNNNYNDASFHDSSDTSTEQCDDGWNGSPTCGGATSTTPCQRLISNKPYCSFDSQNACGVEADDDIVLSADIGGYDNVTQIKFVVINPLNGDTRTIDTQNYVGDDTYTTTFNMSIDSPFSEIFPKLIANEISFEIWDQNNNVLTYVDSNGTTNNCVSTEKIRPRCDSFSINGQVGDNIVITQGDDVDFVCSGGYSSKVTLQGGPILDKFFHKDLSAPSGQEELYLRSIQPYIDHFSFGDIARNGNQPYTFTCKVDGLDFPSRCYDQFNNTCTATVTIEEPDPMCNPAYSGQHIYDFDNSGNFLDGATLCRVGTSGDYEYTGNTSNGTGWIWTCQAGGSSVSCEAYESYCGDATPDGDIFNTTTFHDTSDLPIGYTGEQCDDGGRADGDGCSATCQRETPVCSGGVHTGNINNLVVFGDTLIATTPFTGYFNVDATSVDTSWIGVTGYYFTGSANARLLSPFGSLRYTTGYEYISSGNYTYGFRLQNTGVMNDPTYGVRCTGEIKALEPDPMCNPAYSGQHIYDFDNGGNFLDGATLCRVGTSGDYEYTGNTSNGTGWIWTCQAGGSSVSCEAYESYCGDATVDGDIFDTTTFHDTSDLPLGYTWEQCDDGGRADGDGCSATCQLEMPTCTVTHTPNPMSGFAGFQAQRSIGAPSGRVTTGVRVTSGYFTGIDHQFTIGFPEAQAPYQTGHNYNEDIGKYERGFYIQNGIQKFILSSADTHPGRRCTGAVEVIDTPDVYIRKFQRNHTHSLPSTDVTEFTGGFRTISAMSGDEVWYRLDVINTGTTDIPNAISVWDTLPSYFQTGGWSTGTNCAGVDVALDTYTNALRSGSMTNLSAGTTCSIIITGTITNDDYTQLSCDYQYVNTGNSRYNSVTTTGIVSAGLFAPTLTLDKTFTDTGTMLGETGTFTLTLTNHGTGNAYGVTVTDTLDTTFRFQSQTNNTNTSFSSGGGSNLSWTGIDLAAGGIWTGVVEYLVPTTASLGTVCNTGWVSDDCLGNNVTSGSACVEITEKQSLFSVYKEQCNATKFYTDFPNTSLDNCNFITGNIVVEDNNEIAYRITYFNGGPDEMASFSFVDRLPFVGLTYGGRRSGANADGNIVGVRNGDQLSWTGGPLGVGSGGVLYITGQIGTSPSINAYTNTIEGEGTGNTVVAYPARVGVVKRQKNPTSGHEDPNDGIFTPNDIVVYPGDTIAYELYRYNNTQTPMDIEVRDYFGSGIVFGSNAYSVDPDGSCPGVTNCRYWDLGTKSAGASGYIYLTGTIEDPLQYTQYRNTGLIIYSNNGVTTTGYASVVTANAIQHLTFSKSQKNWTQNSGGSFTQSDIVVFSGDLINYRLYFENPTQETITMNIQDQFPLGLEPQQWSANPTTSLGANGTFPDPFDSPSSWLNHEERIWSWNVDLAPGATGEILITGQIVNVEDYTTYINTGSAICFRNNGLTCGVEDSPVKAYTASFAFRKRVTPNPIVPGSDVTFDLCFENHGAEAITTYNITDYLPLTLEYLPNTAYYSTTNSSGEVVTGTIGTPTITSGTMAVEYRRDCGRIGDPLQGTSICSLGSGDDGCIHFNAKMKY